MAQDEEERLWFIDFHWTTKKTHLKCYDLKERKAVKRISLDDLFGDNAKKSRCRFLTFSKGLFYISDNGLGQGYILDPNNFESVRKFGDGQLNEPGGVVLDDLGNILVADSRNNRLCLYDKEGKWIKNLVINLKLSCLILFF